MRTSYTGPRIFRNDHIKTLVECGEIKMGDSTRLTSLGRGWWLLDATPNELRILELGREAWNQAWSQVREKLDVPNREDMKE